MSANPFHKVMTSKSEQELKSIIEDKDGYTREARSAAIEVLNQRTGSNEFIAEQEEINQQNNTEENKPDERPKDLPKVFDYAAWLLYGSLGLSLFSMIIQDMNGGIRRSQQVSDGYITYTRSIEFHPGPLGWIVLLLSYGFLFYIITRIQAGKNWARIVQTVFVGIGSLLFVFSVVFVGIKNVFDVLGLLQTLMSVTAIVFLFSSKATQWFRKVKDNQYILDA